MSLDLLVRLVAQPGCLKQKPDSLFGLVDKILEDACRRSVVILICYLVGLAHAYRERLVVLHQFAQHIGWRDKVGVVVVNPLEFGNVPDRAEGGTTDLSYPFGKLVRHRKNLVAVIVEQQMVIAKMRAADMPMKILCLQIKRKRIGDEWIEGCGDRADIGGRKIGRSAQGGRPQPARC